MQGANSLIVFLPLCLWVKWQSCCPVCTLYRAGTLLPSHLTINAPLCISFKLQSSLYTPFLKKYQTKLGKFLSEILIESQQVKGINFPNFHFPYPNKNMLHIPLHVRYVSIWTLFFAHIYRNRIQSVIEAPSSKFRLQLLSFHILLILCTCFKVPKNESDTLFSY